ncbi:MAG: glutamate-1-semialdehyde 2,1-aminomutase [Bacteriovoracaceae bacterium]|nr:glutamate-1-semialdehyde 2,1-aminomutase [Bacteriovoracaceae bacterium]
MNIQTELFLKSKKLIPGGVHSPVRSFKGLTSTPRFFKRAEGAYIYDVEEKKYIDFCMSFGPLILGHRNPIVEKALHEGLERGWSYGACEPYSLELAEFLLERIKYVEQLRFVNSGTEAVMTALRLARGVTGRNKIIKFNGCYHGHVDSMLIKAGSGLAGEAEASSAGVPEGIAKDTLVLELGDIEGVKKCFEEHKNQIAAIIIEPLPANNGLMVQPIEFLSFLREICDQTCALLIFDEVISGFRVAFGGMAEITGIRPDISTWGKIIGGGLPVGAIAASKFIMEHLAPIGKVYQAGTLSANPLAMTGGLATLKQLTPENYKKISEQTKKISNVLTNWMHSYNNGQFAMFKITTYASLFWIVPKDNVTKISEIPENLTENFNKLFEVLLEKGIYLAPNAYEVGFVSLAHDDSVIEDLKVRLG